MRLKQITIKKFKSIKEPIDIVLNDEYKFYTFLGKNGSGKTNVLQSIKQALGKQSYHSGREKDFEAEYIFELTNEEVERYFPAIDIIDPTMKRVRVSCCGNEPQIKYVEAPTIEVSFVYYKQELQSILTDLKKAVKKYWDQLRIFEKKEYKQYINDVEVLDEKGLPSGLNEWHLKRIHSDMQEQIKQIQDFFDELYQDDKFKINQNTQFHSVHIGHLHKITFYKLAESQKIELSPMVIKALDLTEDCVERANKIIEKTIERINKKLEATYNKIQECLKRFDIIKEEIYQIYCEREDAYWENNKHCGDLRESFIKLIKDSCYRASYYLDNENTLLFETNERYNDSHEKSKYFNSNNPIGAAFDAFLKGGGYYREEESIFQPNKIGENRLKNLVKVLNERFLQQFVPTFDQGEILGVELRVENNQLQLFVKEKNGDTISFNQTSLGRRWYLTYLFVKQLLKEGDCLFIDEPAAFLHPQAQEEIRNDLIRLSQKGIYVFIATHSPYMMPDDWNQIYNVSMEEKGTRVQAFSSGDELCETIKEELGVKTVSDILFNLSKTILLVEGIADKACIEKFAVLLGFSIQDRYIHVCDGDSILQVAHICASNDIKYQAILDNDNKYKNKKYQSGHSQYKKIIADLIKSPNCIFVGEGEKGALEDYFSEENNKFSYYETEQKKWKISPRLIKKAKTKDDFQVSTLQNFEQLFIKLGAPKLDNSERI